MPYFKTALFILGLSIALSVPQSMSAQSNNYSKSAVPPIDIIGKFMVYKSGAVTTFKRQKLYFVTRTNEYYVHSRSGRSGMSARASYANGVLTLRDVMSPEERRDLAQKNTIYTKCGVILEPPVRFRISAVRDPGSGGYYRDRWTVIQMSPVCQGINVRHHSRDNSCETSCVHPAKGPDDNLTGMRMYSGQDAAMADAGAR